VNPTLAGFLIFIVNVMGITIATPGNLSPASPWPGWAFAGSMNTVNPLLANVPYLAPVGSWTVYQWAVYNLAGDILINYAPNQAPDTFFSDQRASLNLTNFQPGVVTAAADQGTSSTLIDPEVMKGLTISQLANLGTQWGRNYLGVAQSVGTNWGLT